MSSDTVQQVKDKLSIVDVVSQYVKLERAGSSLRARCPFHNERTPSFHVSPERGTYHCFGCGVGGDIFSFVQSIEGLDFKGALKILAEKAGVPLEFTRGRESKDERDRLFELLEVATIFYISKLTDEAKRYLHDRGITDETISAFRIGWAGDAWSEATDYLKVKNFSDKELIDAGISVKGERGLRDKFRNRILFPIADSAGRIVGFSGRIFGEKASPEAPKYLNSPETMLFHKSRILYGFDRAKVAIRKHNFSILVEGQMDLIASHQAGWPNTVAVSGTAFTNDHAVLLKRMSDNLVLALDADQAGIKAAGKAARAALQSGLNVKVAQLPKGLDPADLILKEGAEVWRATIRDSKDIITFLLDVLAEHLPQPDKFRRAVETIVLPYLADVQSPIEREQYQKEISKRLGVSLAAVREAYEKIPTADAAAVQSKIVPEKKDDDAQKGDRVRQAFSLLLWQESIPKPEIDTVCFQKDFEAVIGKESMQILLSLPDTEKESMRFAAERLYGSQGALAKEADALIAMLRRDQLAERLTAATEALKTAEAEGDTKAVELLMEELRILTGEIAKLHTKV